MSRKYGSKKIVSDGLNNYRIGLLGESGIGKSTLIKNVCEKEFGDEGYIFINCGQESNIIDGIIEADAKDFKTVIEIVNDIVTNRDTDYKELKVIVFDTLDQLFSIAEQYTIAKWNRDNSTKPNFQKARSINACYNGFGAGLDVVVTTVLNVFEKLMNIGIAPWYIGHVKTKELTDPITGGTYSKLTTNMTNKYFEAMKEKTNLIGIAAIDRTIEVKSTGKKNIVTHKDITINRVINERRKVSFRDSNFIIDAKSQFPYIVNEIPLDADEFIKAVKDAINAAKNADSATAQKINDFNDAVLEAKEAIQTASHANDADDEEVETPVVDDDDDIVENEPSVDESDDLFDDDTEDGYPEDLQEVVRKMVSDCKDLELKKKVKSVITPYKAFVNVDEDGLKKIYDMLKK